MTSSTFLRVLQTPPEEKGERLSALVDSANRAAPDPDAFRLDPTQFSVVPGSPFAYWVDETIRNLFKQMPRFEQDGRVARVGDHPGDQERYLRLFWEVNPAPRSPTRQWIAYQKGGAFSPYYYDVHLVADWDLERETYFDFHGRKGRTSEHPSNFEFFFRPGLTWPRRTTSGISIRVLPGGSIFADKGPSAFVPSDSNIELLALLSVMNSKFFSLLISLQLGAADVAARSYEVGLVQQTPIPKITDQVRDELAAFSSQCYDLVRDSFIGDETIHTFGVPTFLQENPVPNSLENCIRHAVEDDTRYKTQLAALQKQIDIQVAELYGVSELAEDEEEMSLENDQSTDEVDERPLASEEDNEETGEKLSSVLRPSSLVSDLLMWCVGVAFGRWDVRFALDPSRLPPLSGPFDPLPRCSPGMLVGKDGLPLKEKTLPSDYPLPIAWDGVLVDDESHPRDIVTSVRRVLKLLWRERADDIEQEACQILEVPDLRAYFRDPKNFFNFHTKRYSKSRRKAPIYWLLQSAKRSYGIWLYYPRLNPDLLFHASREYADAKINLEVARLEDLQASLKRAGTGTALKVLQKQVARQADMVAEVKAFGKTLDEAALLELKPDLNDGVLLNIAPLRELVPWKEAARTWDELLKGKYPWSSIDQQIVESAKKGRPWALSRIKS